MRLVRNGTAVACLIAACGVIFFGPSPAAQAPAVRLATIAAMSQRDLRQWDSITQAMLRGGELRVRQVRDDTQIPGRVNDRADQYYRGVRVFGGDISRQMDLQGIVLSLFGNVYSGIDVPVDPGLSADDVRTRVNALAGLEQGPDADPELVILPNENGKTFKLAWRIRAVTSTVDIIQYFLDASSGDVVMQYSDRESQSLVGRALGVLGDNKKISVSGSSPNFSMVDRLRPPVIETNDMKTTTIGPTAPWTTRTSTQATPTTTTPGALAGAV